MKHGPSRFNYFFDRLQPILTTAAKQKNPALWLYRNDARTPLFMLEALAKMYADFHNKKKFIKIRGHFKILEDALGAIDYYDTMAKDLVTNKKIPASVIAYLQAQSREKIQSLNEILTEKGWLLLKDGRISKIQQKLDTADWLREEDDVKKIEEYYGKSIYTIAAFVRNTNDQFTDMETGVHELRRRLRWLSIYPQAVRGTIQLQQNKVTPTHLVKYCTKEIVTSPFNKMPAVAEAKYVLLLEPHYFYALSWMIATLGTIKDNGLLIVAVREALQQTSSLTEAAAYKSTYQFLGTKQAKMMELLDEAGEITRTFFNEQNLEHLVAGIHPLK